MIFYALPVSSYSAKVRIVLVAKGVPFGEREPPGGYRSEAYRAIVPTGTLPAIDDDGFVLAESEAINEYLEERFAAPPMLPQGPQERARVRFLSRFHDFYLEPPVRALFAHINPAKRDAGIVAARVADIRRRMAELGQMIRPCPFIAAQTLTLADCGPAVTVPLAQLLVQALGQNLALPASIGAWQAAVEAHPAVRQVMAPWRVATTQWIAAQIAHRRDQEP